MFSRSVIPLTFERFDKISTIERASGSGFPCGRWLTLLPHRVDLNFWVKKKSNAQKKLRPASSARGVEIQHFPRRIGRDKTLGGRLSTLASWIKRLMFRSLLPNGIGPGAAI